MYVLSWPATYALELTPQCNGRCLGCSNVYAADRSTPPLSGDEWETLLERFAPEAVQLRLTGGEPTLHPQFYQILETATYYDAQVVLFTNGRWHNPESLVQRLGDLHKTVELLVSLHGAKPASHDTFTGITGSFEKTVANIRLAVAGNLPITLSTVITRQSWNEINDIYHLAQEIGVRRLTFARYVGVPLAGIEPTQEELVESIQEIEVLSGAGALTEYGVCIPHCFTPNNSRGCRAGVAYAAIDPWGNLRPCTFSPTIIGSLLEVPLPQLWHSKAMDTWRSRVPTTCTSCAAYSICHGGCRALQELRPEGCDPLIGDCLESVHRETEVRPLPANVRPLAQLRLRPEAFGYAVLGSGNVLPVRAEARPLIDACDGQRTFAELVEEFGEGGLHLWGTLWEMGMLKPA